jgi:hypothetical protein
LVGNLKRDVSGGTTAVGASSERRVGPALGERLWLMFQPIADANTALK